MFDKILRAETQPDPLRVCAYLIYACSVRHNQREDKFLRATNYKHYGSDNTKNKSAKKAPKHRKAVKATSVGFAFVIAAAAFIVPTTTLAPGVEAYADSRIASYAVGDIDKFSAVIADNCVESTTSPVTEAAVEETTEAKPVEETTQPAEEPKAEASEVKKTEEKKAEEPAKKAEEESYDYDEDYDDEDSYYVSETPAKKKSASSSSSSSSSSASSAAKSYSGSVLVDIANPDYSYSPEFVSLSSYDRDVLERLVMGEAGTMDYEGVALVAQSIRDAMNRSHTSSIDQIISEYQYFGSTAIAPNQKVKDAVSFIFDQNGSAVQHRVLCFYIGYSSWHETQTFLTSVNGVRFFDLNF